MDDIQEGDSVALLVDQPDAGLRRGDVGTVVQVFVATDSHPGGLIVEFADESGKVQAEADITDPNQVVRLRFRPVREAA